MGFFDLFTGGGGKTDQIKEAIANGAVIVDVRSAGEYKSGHLKGSVNIPLDSIGRKVDELKKKDKTVITVCRSGMRSASAASQLKSAGINAINGGAWSSFNRYL